MLDRTASDGVYTRPVTPDSPPLTMAQMLTELGPVIYYLRVGGYIKIGFTTDLAKRLRGYPPDAKLLAWRTGVTIRDEGALHRRLSMSRSARNEWYAATPDVIAEVEDAREGCGIAACLRR